jgi:hypothetical protein
MRRFPDLAALLALAMTLPAACGAAGPGAAADETRSVPFDGDDPATPYRALVERLKREAAAGARDDRFAAAVGMTDVGRMGERMLIGAITPRRGVFYYTEYGPYGPGPGATVIRARSRIEVCRFTADWDRLPGGAYAPGLVWAEAALPFPDLDCHRPADPNPESTAAQWHRESADAAYSIVARGAEAGLKAAVVRETWPGRPGSHPHQPFDGGRAASALAGRGDRIVRAIPLLGDQDYYAETASGRSFVGLSDPSMGPGGETRCLVEGLAWPDLASSAGRTVAAANLCRRLFDEYRAAMARG